MTTDMFVEDAATVAHFNKIASIFLKNHNLESDELTAALGSLLSKFHEIGRLAACEAILDTAANMLVDLVPNADLQVQRRSYVAAEAALGSDADEASYRDALARGDKAEIARLDAEAEARRQRAIDLMDKDNA